VRCASAEDYTGQLAITTRQGVRSDMRRKLWYIY
jgi:hypothetical protein